MRGTFLRSEAIIFFIRGGFIWIQDEECFPSQSVHEALCLTKEGEKIFFLGGLKNVFEGITKVSFLKVQVFLYHFDPQTGEPVLENSTDITGATLEYILWIEAKSNQKWKSSSLDNVVKG